MSRRPPWKIVTVMLPNGNEDAKAQAIESHLNTMDIQGYQMVSAAAVGNSVLLMFKIIPLLEDNDP